MKKKFLTCLSLLLMITGCSSQQTSSVTSTSETESEEVVLSDIYSNLSSDNQFDIMQKDDLKTFIEHGTGILYFSFPECPWCQQYVYYLNEVAKSKGLEKVYYRNVLNVLMI